MTEVDVWTSWAVTYRDVIILDADNVQVAVFNLTVNDLNVAANYETLRQIFIDVAVAP